MTYRKQLIRKAVFDPIFRKETPLGRHVAMSIMVYDLLERDVFNGLGMAKAKSTKEQRRNKRYKLDDTSVAEQMTCR